MTAPHPGAPSAGSATGGDADWRRRIGLATLLVGLWLFLVGPWLLPFGRMPPPAGDLGQMAWNLWHVSESIQAGEPLYQTTRVYHPVGANLGVHTLAAGYAPLGLLARAVSGADPRYPFVAYKMAAVLAPLASLIGVVFFVRAFGAPVIVAVAMAVAFAFSDFAFHHLVFLNHGGVFVLPLLAWQIARLFARPTWWRALTVACLAGWSVYLTEMVAFAALAVVLLLPLLVFLPTERVWLREAWLRVGSGRLVVMGTLAFAIALPLLWQWFQAAPLPVDEQVIDQVSANLAGFVVPSPTTTPVYGWLSRRLPGDPLVALDARVRLGMGGFQAFLGIPFLLFALVGMARRWRRVRSWALLAGAFLVLSLGPRLKVFGSELPVPLPFSLLGWLPPFDQHRTPVNFTVMVLFLLVPCAAIGMMHVLDAGRRRFGAAAAGWLAVLALSWMVAEAWSPHTLFTGGALPVAKVAALRGQGPILCLPVEGAGGEQLALQTLHGEPISCGASSRLERRQVRHLQALADAARHDRWLLAALVKQGGYRSILQSRAVSWDQYRRVQTLGLPRVSVAERPYFTTASRPLPARLRAPLARLGEPMRFGLADEDAAGLAALGGGWSTQEAWGVRATGTRAALRFRLAEIRPLVARLTLHDRSVSPLDIEVNGQLLHRQVDAEAADPLEIRLPATALALDNRLVVTSPPAVVTGGSRGDLRLAVASLTLTLPEAP